MTSKDKDVSTDRGIVITGAFEHNLQNISCVIPHHTFTVVTGPSGSGKSSLVFETLYREAVRRYFSSLSGFKGDFGILPQTKVKRIEGLSFAYAIGQNVHLQSISSLATLADLYQALALLFFHLGVRVCPRCKMELLELTRSQLLERLKIFSEETKIQVFAPLGEVKIEDIEVLSERLIQEGFTRVRVNGTLSRLEEFDVGSFSDSVELAVEVFIDSFSLKGDFSIRLFEAIEVGHAVSENLIRVEVGEERERLEISKLLRCTNCDFVVAAPTLNAFFYYRKEGACSECGGLGTSKRERSKKGGRVCTICCGQRLRLEFLESRLGDISFGNLFQGSVIEALRWAERLTTKGLIEAWHLRVHFPLEFDKKRKGMLENILFELKTKLQYLHDIGLGYLELSRAATTLSRGEYQRAHMARQLGSNLQGVCYLFDEPSIGLHPHDTEKLIFSIRKLVAAGNTAVVIEHDPAIIKQSDYILELGPESGKKGGQIIWSGEPRSYEKEEIQKKEMLKEGSFLPQKQAQQLTIKKAAKHNLKKIEVTIPLQSLVAITGVSGSGKTSLLFEVLLPALKAYKKREQRRVDLSHNELTRAEQNLFGVEALSGFELIGSVVTSHHFIKPRGGRSIVATLAGLLKPLRELFSKTVEAKIRGWDARYFTFLGGGRCPDCQGRGFEKKRITFGQPVSLVCPRCGGRRYSSEIERAKYKGVSIVEVLEMTVEEVLAKFSNVPKVREILHTLCEVGLGYLRLSQPSLTLSRGELQRVRLAADLNRGSSNSTLYLFDEPSEGQHEKEVRLLVKLLQKLVEKGNSVVVIEHNLQLIKSSDYVIDLGPGAGKAGGEVIATGFPLEVSKNPKSSLYGYLENIG